MYSAVQVLSNVNDEVILMKGGIEVSGGADDGLNRSALALHVTQVCRLHYSKP